MPVLDLSDASVFYIQRGEGPDIVWIPGGDSLATDWNDQISVFEKNYRNTAFDPRGAGQTVSRRQPPWSIADYAADCASLIRAACTPPVFIVGLSMGSKITLEVAMNYPELVRAAIPMGVSPRATGFLRDWMIAEVEFRRQGGRLSREFAIHHYAAFMYPAEVIGDDKLWAEIRPLVERSYGEREGQFLAAQWQACIDYDATERLPQCQVPIHVIAFSEDMQTPVPHGRRVAKLAPKGHFHLLDGLGHVSMAGHRAEEVNSCIRQIIESYA
jgi:3-oxoadipate enol-lactonase